jgi:hypothetical protein
VDLYHAPLQFLKEWRGWLNVFYPLWRFYIPVPSAHGGDSIDFGFLACRRGYGVAYSSLLTLVSNVLSEISFSVLGIVLELATAGWH